MLVLSSRIISGILSFIMMFSPIGFKRNEKTDEGGVKTVTVAQSGGDFKSIEAARDYLRTLDKSKYDGVEVTVKAGTYTVTEPIVFTKEDGGTEDCPITYTGENGTVITGGVTFTSKDFSGKLNGNAVEYFKADAKANIVSIDLKKFGFTVDDIEAMYVNPETGATVYSLNGVIPVLYAGGEMATVCRYPNDGYATFETGKINSPNGAKDARDLIDTETFIVSDEYAEEMNSWHDLSKVFVKGRFSVLWVEENARITSLDGKTLTIPFAGGYDPHDGMFFYCQNAPEMLDTAGEYYIDDNAVLYYYKDENFEGEDFTIPFADTIIKVDGAEYMTLDGFTIESAKGDIIDITADNFTVRNCEVRDSGNWIKLVGDNNLVENCSFHDFSNGILFVTGGNCDTLTKADTLITNNEFCNWGILGRVYYEAVRVEEACGITVSHNEMHDAPHMAVGWTGNFNTFEYNEIYDVCNDTDDAGAMYSYNSYAHYGNVFRYNYIHDIRAKDETIMNVENYPYCHVSGIYWDGGKSGQTAQFNIFENISGAGVVASGRDETVTNNLFISCGWGVTLPATYWVNVFIGGLEPIGWSAQGMWKYNDNEIWEKTFPQLYEYNWDNHDENDPNYAGAPAGNVLKDNYFFFDKANVKSIKLYGHAFQNDIPECVTRFSGENIVDAVEGVNQTTYSSRRTPITVRDAIEKTSSITGITIEEFEKIGRTGN